MYCVHRFEKYFEMPGLKGQPFFMSIELAKQIRNIVVSFYSIHTVIIHRLKLGGSY